MLLNLHALDLESNDQKLAQNLNTVFTLLYAAHVKQSKMGYFCTLAFTDVFLTFDCFFLSPSPQALCINVQGSDVLETLSLIFCGANVNCSTGMTAWPTPLSLANAHSQPLQAELISHNLNTGTV